MENIYPAYLGKIQRNNSWAKDNSDNFARQLNTEYKKARKSKAKDMIGLANMPVRIYGSGDYIREHYDFLSKLTFKFYIISKSLTIADMQDELNKLQQLDNCTRIVLSFDNQNIKNYDAVKHLYKTDGIQFAFTGDKDDWTVQEWNNRQFGIYFNTGRKKVDKEFSKAVSKSCPDLADKIPHDKACSICNKCWRSSKTKGQFWNAQYA